MILQSLTQYYEALCAAGKIPTPGWSDEKVSYGLDVDADGKPQHMYCLKTVRDGGTKAVPRTMVLPARVKKTSGKRSNFISENAQYLLGLCKGKDALREDDAAKNARECFDCAAKCHHEILDGTDDAAARAVCAFFDSWDVEAAQESSLYAEYAEDLNAGANVVLMVNGKFAQEYDAIRKAWQQHYDGGDDESGERMRCLVTGEQVVPASVHPSIKGVYGAQSSGAALVSFNADAFCSFGRNGEQNLNAPVGKYAAFAYTSALNRLLSDAEHVVRIGETTVVFWAKSAERTYQDLFAACLNGDGGKLTESDLRAVMNKLARGEPIDSDGATLDPESEFSILGISPNAARLCVRFFLQNSFGQFMSNLQKHYELTDIVSDGRNQYKCIPLWLLLRETVNEKAQTKTPKAHMAADTLNAILSGTAYPATLFQLTEVRIRADRNMNRARAAIIKAYLLKKYPERYGEVIQVELNEATTYAPYVLGRLFAVLESIQQDANPTITTTIKDKYFSSACATPAVVFPTLIKLAQSHLKKMDTGRRIYFEKKLTALMGMLTDSYPTHLELRDQGIFQLGYYHETQKRYEKKTKNTEAE